MLPFEVVDRNLDMKVSLTRGPDITGRIIPTDGAKAPTVGAIKISTRTEIGPVQFGDEGQPVTPDDAGNFRFTEVPLARQRITVSGLGTDKYIKEIRYNGIPLIDKFFVTDGGSPVQTLDIVIDDKTANITGAVTDHDKPVSEPYVVLVRWPSTPENVFLAAKHSTGDDKGQFRFTGLAPGEYRVLSVSPTTMQKLEESKCPVSSAGKRRGGHTRSGRVTESHRSKLTDPEALRLRCRKQSIHQPDRGLSDCDYRHRPKKRVRIERRPGERESPHCVRAVDHPVPRGVRYKRG